MKGRRHVAYVELVQTGHVFEDLAIRWLRQAGFDLRTETRDGGQFGFELRCSPVLAADILEECLWSRAAGVVVTSATITALNSFERFILHSGAPRDGNFKVVASPFDYANAVFSVPAMDCDPGDAQAHTDALISSLPEVLDESEGSLVLFSSRRQMLVTMDRPNPAST